jgi:hypothetical protein
LADSESESDSVGFDNNYSIRQSKLESIKGLDDEILKVHGVVPGAKAEGVTRLLYENPGGFNTRLSNNAKLDKSKELIDNLEADIVAFSEHRINLQHKDNQNGLLQMFCGGESEIRSIAAHNSHEGNITGRSQEGGTGLLLFGPVIEQYDFENSSKDPTGLRADG